MRIRREEVAAEQPSLPGTDVPVWEANMNAEQLEVIRHEGGPLACFAGAGSGKTRALVHRVARLVALGTPAERIFCVTFSQGGAKEMNARLRALDVPATVQTWHAFCLRVLKEERVREGSWEVDEKNRAKFHVKTAMGFRHEDWKGGDLTKVVRFIGNCKAELLVPEDPETTALARKAFGGEGSRAVRVYSISQNLIEEAGLLTFDDMLVYVARYFRDDDEMRRRWAARFDYILQDEAQDANLAQVTIASQLARESRNYMIVGDPGQAIFGFRGSKPDYLAGFPGAWDGAKVVTMAKNYRSGDSIVRVANEIIRAGSHHLPEDMAPMRGIDGKVRVVSCETLEDEGGELVDFVRAHLAAGGKAKDVCVLYRLNAQSRAPEEALLKANVPYVIVGGTNFYERKEVKDLLAYLRLALGRDKDGDAVKRCINAPFRFLGAKFVEKVQDARERDSSASWESCVLRACNAERIQDRQRRAAFDWVALVEEVRKMATEPDAEERLARADAVLSFLVNRTGYVAWLEKEEGEDSVETSHASNVRELIRVSTAFDSVAAFLDFVEKQLAESAKNKRRAGSADAVTLMTVHKSKGLEWPIVWVVGCCENVLPHAKGDPEEERRLMYVAATRARDELVVSHVAQMAMKTGVKTVERSRYLSVFPTAAEDSAEPEAPAGLDLAEREAEAVEDAYFEGEAAERNPGSALPSGEILGEDFVTGKPATIADLAAPDAFEMPAEERSARLSAVFGNASCAACGCALGECEC